MNALRWLILAGLVGLACYEYAPRLDTLWRVEAAPRPVTARGELEADERNTIDVFDRSKSSVVYISTVERVLDPWTRNVMSVPRGTGSGFVWDEQGHLVTNLHVVSGASEAKVRLNDGRDYAATLVGVSRAHDLAVLRIRIPGNAPRPVPLGASADLRVGQKVFAIGNPFGLDWTLTTGIVSALDRGLPSENGGIIEHLIQTDAAINPGNSGGPLLDSAGRLIGINTAIYSPSGASAGIGFAVPVDTLNRVVPQLISTGRYTQPGLAIQTDQSLNDIITRELGVAGVAVLKVAPGSSAAAAGLRGVTILDDNTLRAGDIITAVNDQPVDGIGKLAARFDDHAVGERVRLSLWRAGRNVVVDVTLEALDGRP